MADQNVEWMLNAKRNSVAPRHVDPSDLVELEMWRSYRSQLIAELAEIDRLLDAALIFRPFVGESP